MVELIIENKKYVSTRLAAVLLKCTNDYAGKLAREGKIAAIRHNNFWFIEEAAIQDYLRESALQKSIQRKELSKQREIEYHGRNESLKLQEKKLAQDAASIPSLFTVQQALMVAACFMVLVATKFLASDAALAHVGVFDLAQHISRNVTAHSEQIVSDVGNAVIGFGTATLKPVKMVASDMRYVGENYVAGIYTTGRSLNGVGENINYAITKIDQGISHNTASAITSLDFAEKRITSTYKNSLAGISQAFKNVYDVTVNSVYAVGQSVINVGQIYSKGVYAVADTITGIVDEEYYADQLAVQTPAVARVPQKDVIVLEQKDEDHNTVVIQRNSVIAQGISELYLERRLAVFKESLDLQSNVTLVNKSVEGSRISMDRIYDDISDSSNEAAEDAVTGGDLSFSGINGTFTGDISVDGALNVTGTTTLSGAVVAGGDTGTNGYVLQTTGMGVQWVATSTLGISGGGGGTWGSITGTLSSQTDLQDAFDLKQNLIATGTTAEYFRGDLSLATFPTTTSAFTNDSGFLTSYTETDPEYTSSSWYTTTNNSTDWDTAYGWGDHAGVGYLTSYTEVDTLAAVTARGATTSDVSTFSTAIKTPKIYPSADSTSAFGIFKADGSTNIFNVDSTNSRIGIGTTTPGDKLELYDSSDVMTALGISTPGTSGSQQVGFNLKTNSTKKWTMYARGNSWGTAAQQNDFGVSYYNGSSWIDPFWIDSGTGYVGIGTATPSYPLHVYGTSAAGGAIQEMVENNTATGYAQLVVKAGTAGGAALLSTGQSYVTSGVFVANMGGLNSAASGAVGIISQNASAPMIFVTGGTATSNERMRITSAGNVGIGTTNPGVPLAISKAVNTTFAAGGSGVLFNASNTGTGDNILLFDVSSSSAGDPGVSFLIQGSGGWIQGVDNSDSDKFKISSTWDNLASGARLTIDTSGNVGIGTTTPTSLLHVALPSTGDTYSTGLRLARGTGYIEFNSGTTGDSNFYGRVEAKGNNNAGLALALAIVARSGSDSDTSYGVINLSARNVAGTGAIGNTQKAYEFSNYITPLMTILGNGNVGIGTTVPDKKLEINLGTSDALRLNYNDSDGSAATYVDTTISSTGAVTWDSAGSDASLNFSDQMRGGNGSAAAPSFSFTGNTGTGMWRQTNWLMFSTNGVNGLGMTSGGRVHIGTMGIDNAALGLGNAGVAGDYLIRLRAHASQSASILHFETSGQSSRAALTSGYLWQVQDGSAATPAYSFLNDTDVGIFRATTNELGFSTGGSERMRLNSSGNLGIGTTNPQMQLTLGSNTANTYSISSALAPSIGQYKGWAFGDATGSNVYAAIRFHNDAASDSSMRFLTWAGVAGGTEVMSITGASSRVGVGISVPLAKLHTVATTEQLRLGFDASNYFSTTVASTSAVTFDAVGSGSAFLFSDQIRSVDGSVSTPAYSFTNDTNTGTYRPTTDALGFVTAGSERVRIDASGNVGIGTTTPDSLLTVGGDFNLTGAIKADGDAGTPGYIMQSTGTGVEWVATSSIGFVGGGGPSVWSSSGADIYFDTGNVGIGTSTPGQLLTIGDNAYIATDGSAVFSGGIKGGPDGFGGYYFNADFNNATLNDPSGTSVDWTNRTLYANDGTTANLKWESTDGLYGGSSLVGFIDLATGMLSSYNAQKYNSIDYVNRTLYANDGTTNILDWSTASDGARFRNSGTYSARIGSDTEAGFFTGTGGTVYISDSTYAINATGIVLATGVGTDVTGSLANSGYGVVGNKNSTGTAGGYFDDFGSNSVTLADGTYSINSVGLSQFNNGAKYSQLATANEAGYFDNGAGTNIIVANGTYAINATGASSRFANGTKYSILASSSEAGYFNDGTNIVSLSTGAYAIDATGSSYFSNSVGIGMAPTSAMLGVNYGSVYARLGDGGNIAGIFEDGTNTVNLANGTYAINATGNSYFSSGSSYVDILNPTQGLVLSDGATTLTFLDSGIGEIFNGNFGVGQSVIFGSSVLGQFINGSYTGEIAGGSAGYFSDTTNTVSLADSTYAINATGDVIISGSVGIGTTTPSFPLDVTTVVSSNQAYGYLNPGGTTGTASGTNDYSIRAVGRIIAPEFNAVSDGRLKNVNFNLDSDLALDLISQLQPLSFNWKDQPDGQPVIGFIAQGVESVIPNAVSRMETANFSDQRSLDYNQLVAVSIGAIQALNLRTADFDLPDNLGELIASGDFESVLGLDETGSTDILLYIREQIATRVNVLSDFVAVRITAMRAYVGDLFADKVTTNKLCIPDSNGVEVCLTGDELRELLGEEASEDVTEDDANADENDGDTTDSSGDSDGDTPIDEGDGAGDAGTDDVVIPNTDGDVEGDTGTTDDVTTDDSVTDNTDAPVNSDTSDAGSDTGSDSAPDSGSDTSDDSGSTSDSASDSGDSGSAPTE